MATKKVSKKKVIKKSKQITSKNIKESRKEPPTSIRTIAIINFIYSALLILGALFFIVVGIIAIAAGPTILGDEILQDAGPLISIAGAFLIVFGLISLGIGILYFFVGKGLWKGKNWARITSIILSIIGVIFTIMFLVIDVTFSNLVGLIISAGIIYYLGFDEKTKSYFKK